MHHSLICTKILSRGGSRPAATFKMERFVIIVNGFLTIITKRSILDVPAALDPPLFSARCLYEIIRVRLSVSLANSP